MGCKAARVSSTLGPQALEGGPLAAPELQNKMEIHKKHTMNIKQMRTVLRKLGQRHADVHPVVAKNQDGRYHLTETGRQALIQRKKLVKAQRPRHRRVEWLGKNGAIAVWRILQKIHGQGTMTMCLGFSSLSSFKGTEISGHWLSTSSRWIDTTPSMDHPSSEFARKVSSTMKSA